MLRGLLRPRLITPHAGPVPRHTDVEPVATGKSGALRAAIFGINDGLVSNLALIMGFTGANASNEVIVLAGIAGLLAGAFSMAAGEYVSMRAQREVFERLIHLEAHELATEPEEEREELIAIFRSKGVPAEVAEQVVDALHQDPQLALETHAREELGLDAASLGSPWAAAASSLVTFAFGAFVPVLPFMIGSGIAATLAAIAAAGVTLFVVGSLLSRLTGRGLLFSGMRMLVIGAAAAATTFGIGNLFHVATT